MMNLFCCTEDSFIYHGIINYLVIKFLYFLWYIGEPFSLRIVNVFIEMQLSSQKLVA